MKKIKGVFFLLVCLAVSSGFLAAEASSGLRGSSTRDAEDDQHAGGVEGASGVDETVAGSPIKDGSADPAGGSFTPEQERATQRARGGGSGTAVSYERQTPVLSPDVRAAFLQVYKFAQELDPLMAAAVLLFPAFVEHFELMERRARADRLDRQLGGGTPGPRRPPEREGDSDV